MTVTNLTPPVVSGTAQQGQTLQTTTGTWDHDEPVLTYEYQWRRCDAAGANCANITGATEQTYLLTAADVGSTIRSRITATESTPAPSDAYFVMDYEDPDGKFATPASSLFSYSGSGSYSVGSSGPTTGTSDGRVTVVADPGGGGGYAARFEIRDSDPPWPPLTSVDKSEERSTPNLTWNGSLSYGMVRWFSTDIWLPYNGSEKFEFPSGGSKPFVSIIDMHTGSSTGWSSLQVGIQAFQKNAGNPLWIYFNIYGGVFPSTNDFEGIKLWQVTDSGGSRVMANHNRWINLVWGMKMAPDNSGWLNIYVDGQNVYPQKSRPTMWQGDFNSYFKHGLYRQADATFPESGKSIYYVRNTTIGNNQP